MNNCNLQSERELLDIGIHLNEFLFNLDFCKCCNLKPWDFSIIVKRLSHFGQLEDNFITWKGNVKVRILIRQVIHQNCSVETTFAFSLG